MKTAQAKIEVLLDVLIERLQDVMTAEPAWPPEQQFAELKRLIELSNLNNLKTEKVGKPAGPQSKVTAASDEELIAELKSKRPKDLFPRRGPPNGKRPSVAPLPEKPEPRFCDIHTGVICVENPDDTSKSMWICPECVKESPPETFVSLKALL